LAGTLLFAEQIRQSAALFWFGLRNVEVLHSQAAIQRTIETIKNLVPRLFAQLMLVHA
jgi:hypothetical protein